MKKFQGNILMRKILVIFCAIFACFALIAGLSFSGIFGGAQANEGDNRVAGKSVQEDTVISPYHDYHTVTAGLYNENVLIFVDKTTVADLKQNLIVRGAFNIGSTSQEVYLSPSEYTVSVKVGALSVDLSDSDKIITSSASADIEIIVTSNGKSSSVTFNAENIVEWNTENHPSYKSITASPLSGIENDFTADTLKYAVGFGITGVKDDGTEEQIVNLEFVSVNLGALGSAGSSSVYSVAYTDFEGNTITSANASITGIKQSTLINATLAVNSEYSLVNHYWVDKNGNSVFVTYMTRGEILNGLILTAHYTNSSNVLTLSGDGPEFTLPTGEIVTWQGSQDLGTPNDNFLVNLTVSAQGKSVDASVNIPLEARRVVGIEVDESCLNDDGVYEFAGELYPYSSTYGIVEELSGKIIAKYNSGATVKLESGFTITDYLTPTADAIIDCVQNGKDTYFKTLNVSYTSDSNTFTAPVTVEVNYEKPSIVFPAFTVTSLATQYMRQPFNYSGINVTLTYTYTNEYDEQATESYTIPLADFVNEDNDFVLATFKDSSGAEISGLTEFNKAVQRVTISFRYSKSDSWISQTFSTTATTGNRLTVSKLPLAIPSIGAFEEYYGPELDKSITFAEDFDDITLNNLLADGIGIYDDPECKVPSVTASVDGLALNFNAGGTYYLRFKLSSDDSEEVRWDNTNYDANYVTLNADGSELIYRIVINRGPIDIKIQPDKDSTVYGTETGYSVSIAPRGSSVFTPIDTEGTNTQLKVEYFYYDTDGSLKSTLSYPKNVGTYYLVVTILSSDAYEPCSSYAPNPDAPAYSAPSFKILPKPLGLDNVPEFDYARKDFYISDFLKASGFQYSDQAEGVLKYIDANGTEKDLSDAVFRHVGDSTTIQLKIVSANYVWTEDPDNAVSEIKITINPLQLNLTLSGDLDFVYGGLKGGLQLDKLPEANITTDNSIFAKISDPEYYFAAGFSVGADGAVSGTKPTGSFDAWTAGEYIIYYGTTLNDGDTDGDYNLPYATVGFTISKAQIKRVEWGKDEYGNNSSVYSASDKILTLLNAAEDSAWSDGKIIVTVSAQTHDGYAINKDITENKEFGKITVRHAGVYEISVTLNPNYVWVWEESGVSQTGEDKLDFTYTVEQKELSATEIDWGVSSFIFNGSAQTPDVKPQVTSELASVTTKIYSVLNGGVLSSEISKDKVISVGTYYVAVTGWTATDGGTNSSSSFSLAKNYKPAFVEFSITSSGIVRPELTTGTDNLTLTYNGTAYSVKDYIDNQSEFFFGTNQSKIEIYVVAVGTNSSLSSFNKGAMTDVCTYNVYIYPAANYDWSDKITGKQPQQFTDDIAPGDSSGKYTGYKFTFEIEKAELTLNWGENSFIYNGATQSVQITSLGGVYSVGGVKDDVKVEVISGSYKTAAGNGYTAEAAEPTGTRAFNYKLPAAKTATFDIVKYTVSRPTVSQKPASFGDSDKTVKFNMPALTNLTGSAWNSSFVTVAISGEYHEGLSATVAHTDSYSFVWSGFSFTATNAGRYTVVFTLNDTDNFQWSETGNGTTEGGVYTAESIEVARQEITAPALSARTISHESDNHIPGLIWGTTGKDLVGEPQYGVFDRVSGKHGGLIDGEPSSVGEYYVLLNIVQGNPLNFVWVENSDDMSPSQFITEGFHYTTVYEYEAGAANVSVYINFAITQRVLDITYSIGGYTYGENNEKSFGGIIAMNKPAELLAGGSFVDVKYSQSFTFADKDRNIIGVVVIDRDGGITADEKYTLLENLLPWYAGSYSVTVDIAFEDANGGDQLEDLTLTIGADGNPYTLTVLQKQITASSVIWSGEKEVTYDADTHTLTAELDAAFVPVRSNDTEKTIPSLTVQWQGHGENLPKDASSAAYILAVTGVSDSDNYSLADNLTEQLTILKLGLNIVVDRDTVIHNVYGNGLDFTGVEWTYETENTAVLNELKTLITFVLEGVSGNKPNAGTYDIIPVLTADGQTNYEITEYTEGVFKIDARTVTVSIKEGLSSAYGSAVNLYSPEVYNVVWTIDGEEQEGWLAEGDKQDDDRQDVFTLTPDAFDAIAEAKYYDITVTLIGNGNYAVSFVGGTGADDNSRTWENAYQIVKAEIDIISVTPHEKTYTAEPYDYIDGLLTLSAKAVNNQQLSWYIAEATDENMPEADPGLDVWKVLTGLQQINHIDKNYWVMAVAPNHVPEIYANPVRIYVAKAQLEVSLDFGIYYGEENPATVGYLSTLSDLMSSPYFTVGELLGEDTLTSINLGGSFSYSVPEYAIGSKTGGYNISLDVDLLTSDNYYFEAVESLLTVEALPVLITIENRSEVYWQNVGANYNLNAFVTVEITQPSTYDGSVKIQAVDEASDVVTLNTSAVTVQDGILTAMLSVGEYPLYAVFGNLAANYDITVVTSDGKTYGGTESIPENAYAEVVGVYEITYATLTETAIDASYELVFDESEHTLKIDGENVTKDTVFATASNGMQVTVEFATSADGEYTEALPKFIDANSDGEVYSIYYRIAAENYQTVNGYRTIKITPAVNIFEKHFAFESAYVSATENGIFAAAWTYGLYNNQSNSEYYNPDGYNANGAQSVSSVPTTKFNRLPGGGDNEIIYTLYNVNGNAEIYSCNNLEDLFGYVISEGLFDAGTYRLHYKMNGNTNYSAAEGERYFSVAKKQLEITAKHVSVAYGDSVSAEYYTEANGFAYDVTGLVNNGKTEESILNVFGGKLPYFASAYNRGYENGKVTEGGYAISLNNESDLNSANYSVTVNGNTLTVTPREITVTIDTVSSQYNFNAASGGTPTTEETIVPRVTGEKNFFAEEPLETVISFVTNATVKNGESIIGTQDVGVYPVFAMFNNAKDKGNYAITVIGAFNKSLADETAAKYAFTTPKDYYKAAEDYYNALNSQGLVIGGTDGAAGVYEILPANLRLSTPVLSYLEDGEFKPYAGSEHAAYANFYDGLQKGHTATASGDYSGEKFYAVYSENADDLKLDGNPDNLPTSVKNVGTYYYKFVIENPNYIWLALQDNYFEIHQRTLSWSVDLKNADGTTKQLQSNTYGATYQTIAEGKDNNYYLTYTFGNFVDGEAVGGDISVDYTADKLVNLFGNVSLKNTSSAMFDGNVFTLTAKNAGTYTVTLTLDSGLGNYTFSTYGGSSSSDVLTGSTIKFSFTINRATIHVTADNSAVQYGSPLSGDRFGGFALKQEWIDLAAAENSVEAGVIYFDYGSAVYNTDYRADGSNNNAGSIFNIVLQSGSITALNYVIVTEGNNFDYGLLTVLKREITVRLNGYEGAVNEWSSVVYDGTAKQPSLAENEKSFLTYSGDWYGSTADRDIISAAALVLSIDDGLVNVGNYPMFISQDPTKSTNYNVTFVNKDGTELNRDTAEADRPVFNIRTAKLTVQVVLKNTGNTSFEIVYGNIASPYFGVKYIGLVDIDKGATDFDYNISDKALVEDNLVYSAKKGSVEYQAWFSQAGESYTVSASGLSLHNYEITYLSATMKIVSRKVTAVTSDRVYTANPTDYNGGAFGIQHNAQIVFTDSDSRINNAGVYYSGEYDEAGNIMYNGKDGSISYGEGSLAPAPNNYISLLYSGLGNDGTVLTNRNTAPMVAGTYSVKVTFDFNDNRAYNFIFDVSAQSGTDTAETTVTLEYNVEKQLITNFDWAEKAAGYLEWKADEDNSGKFMNIPNFIEDLMVAYPVQRLYGSDNAVDNIITAPNGFNDICYVEGENGLVIQLYGLGSYTAVISFNSAAANNYKWKADDSEPNVTLTFRVSTNSFTFTRLTMSGWTYGEYNDVSNAPSYTLSIDMTVPVMIYTYARVTAVPDNVRYGTMLDSLEGITYGYFVQSPPSNALNADTYLLRAYYPGDNTYTDAAAYLLFVVSPKTVTKEQLYFTDTENELSYSTDYNGREQIAQIYFDTGVLMFSYSGAEIDGNNITLRATDAKSYTISFSLQNTQNYAWDESFGKAATESVALEWIINKASDNVIDWNDEEIGTEYGTGFALDATVTYNGGITYYYSVRGDEQSPLGNAEWSVLTSPERLPHGQYWLRAVGDGTDNYFDSQPFYRMLTVYKATLTVTAYGSMTYGDGFDKHGNYGYEISGFVNGEDEGLLSIAEISYELVGVPDKPEAQEYGITLASTGGYVNGMEAENYYIVAETGRFTVYRRAVSVIIGDGESVYGEKIDLSGIAIEVFTDNLAEGDSIDDLNITLVIDERSNADMDSLFNDANSYRINATGYTESKNYEVSVIGSGVYTIYALEIYINVEAGGGVYGKEITPASPLGIYAVDGGDDVNAKFGSLAPTFSFNYSGVANDGTRVDGTTVPVLAGTYLATAVASNNRNFTLVTRLGTPGVAFVIEKQPLDVSKISAQPKSYTGNAIVPEITDGSYSALYTAADVSFVNVGNYVVPLTLNDTANYAWSSGENEIYNLAFEIVRSDNNITGISIKGWTYGGYGEENLPEFNVLFDGGDYVYMYSSEENGTYTTSVPSAAGSYWLKISVPQSANYNAYTSEPVRFEISKLALEAPRLVIVTEGEQRNDTYTGSRLQSDISGYDPSTMRIIYGGEMLSSGNTVSVYATNAGTYSVSISLNNTDNYEWAESVQLDGDGNALLVWTVARMKLAKPTGNTDTFMVNGRTLTYIPVGFDENTMAISGNETSYGGLFQVTVSLKDTENYEWADSSVEDITFDWFVVGWDTVFTIVLSVLGVVAGVALIAVGVQFLLHRNRKKRALLAENAPAQAQTESVSANAENTPKENSEPENIEETVKKNVEEAIKNEKKKGGKKNV